jgi:hypothetical protein
MRIGRALRLCIAAERRGPMCKVRKVSALASMSKVGAVRSLSRHDAQERNGVELGD